MHKTYRIGKYKVGLSVGSSEHNYMPSRAVGFLGNVRRALPKTWSNAVQGWTLNIWHFRLRIKQVW